MAGWISITDFGIRRAFVLPVDDALDHDDEADDCVCGPTLSLIEGPDDGDFWMLTHHALDGRP